MSGPKSAWEVAVPGPLAGLRVIEFGQLIAGPFCAQLLGDMGADVIKVEPPGAGDPMRQWGRGDPPVWWEVIARNKRSVSLNLREPEGQELARRLVADADILIENFRPGTLERWNLAPETLMAGNHGLIVVRISGYGQNGPYAQRTGFGGIGEAMGGWRGLVGDPDRPPSRLGVSIGDSLAGTFGALGALAALRERESSGKGQVVDSALYEAVFQMMESLVPDYDATGFVRERSGPILPGIAPSNVYRCSDGEYLIAANHDQVFARLAAAMGRPDLTDDPRYATHAARGQHQDELDALIADWTRDRTVADVEAVMTEHAVPAGRIFTAEDMLADAHFKAREAIVSVMTKNHGSLQMQSVFPKLSRTPGAVRAAAPASVGADNAEILGALGLDDDEREALAAKGVI
ncbi:MAG: CoA transferase [Parasphingopyxis sp.]|uniref:CaiB/BaiF CoA transferase family protein n=1 Tax=Parasphingopyxis sp. TaxID=1920299 RepID=UPI0032EC140B